MNGRTSCLTSPLDNEKVLAASVTASNAFDTLRYVFKTLPECEEAHMPGVAWRVLFSPADSPADYIPVEIRGDTIVGLKTAAGPRVDLDLTDWSGYQYGISRQHIRLRPTKTKLFIIELNSTNGTHVNGLPIGPSWAHALNSGDVLTLGLLSIRIIIFAPTHGSWFT